MRPQLHRITRVVMTAVTLSLIATYFVPLWRIQLWAPQYPEGLVMKIWINHISGAFDIINGLNHYIGMRTIHAEMFPEFRIMGWLVGGIIAVGLLPALLGRRIWLNVYAGLLCFAGLAGLADYYRWGYDYGHHLDPHAAIVVPGMSYQPPLLGYKNLLNFLAYSGPDVGGWIFIAVGVIVVGFTGWEYWRNRQPAPRA